MLYDIYLDTKDWQLYSIDGEPARPKGKPPATYLTDGKATIPVRAAKTDHPGGVVHCLVTDEQIEEMKKQRVEFVDFVALDSAAKTAASAKRPAGAPRHVFGGGGSIACPPNEKDETRIYWPGRSEPEVMTERDDEEKRAATEGL